VYDLSQTVDAVWVDVYDLRGTVGWLYVYESRGTVDAVWVYV